MTDYVEPTPKARQLFFLAAILWAACVTVVFSFDDFWPLPTSPLLAIEQLLRRMLVVGLVSTLFHVGLAVITIHYARRALACGQWPSVGMAVPFRTRVKRLDNPRNVWRWVGVALCLYAVHTGMTWGKYAIRKDHLEEIRKMIEQVPGAHQSAALEGSYLRSAVRG